MEIVYRVNDVKGGIWNIGAKALIKKDGSLIDLMNLKRLDYDIKDAVRCFYDNGFVFIIKSSEIILIDSNLKYFNTIKFNKATGIRVFSKNNYAIWYEDENEDEYFDIYAENIKVDTGKSFFGKMINFSYSYRFKNRKDRDSFKLSNLMGTHTYFEYQCDFNEEVTGEIIFYNEKLIFYTKEKNKELYDTLFWVNILDVKTGEKAFKVGVKHYEAYFDYENGLFVSVQCTNSNNEIVKRFEVLNVNNGIMEQGNLDFDSVMFAVGTATQCFQNNKLYFVDNIYSYEEQKRKSPKIGCFDVETKQIIFFEELKEAEDLFVNQITSIEGSLLIKTDNEQVFTIKI